MVRFAARQLSKLKVLWYLISFDNLLAYMSNAKLIVSSSHLIGYVLQPGLLLAYTETICMYMHVFNIRNLGNPE